MKIAGMKTLLLGVMALLYAVSANAATTLLPNGKQCFSAVTGINGMVGLLGSITGGSGYVNGVYGNVALTGGAGSGATANITVSGGAVTSVLVQLPGINYVAGNTLSAASASIGGSGAGFSVGVASIAVNASMAGGQVNMFVPSTTTIKPTWQDSGQIAANPNPIILDGNGCAVIYGTGQYRQQLLDSLGNLVWDQITTDTSAFNAVFWAGNAAGTPNAITVVDSGFNGTDGSVIQFIPLSTNNGPATLNPSGFGNIPIVKDTGAGAVALTGGELVAGSPSNIVSVAFSSSQFNFHIINLISPTNPTTPQTICGAIGLQIANDVGTPASKLDVTADQVTMITTGGQTISRTGISLVLNLTINGANGLDTGAVANGTFYHVWAIDNGAGVVSLASLSPTAPTLPGGYSYKCRLGAVKFGTGVLDSGLQVGNKFQYAPASIKVIASGISGTLTIAAFVGTSTSLAGVVPPTATSVTVAVTNANTNTNAALAPNNNFSGFGSQVKPPPIVTANITTNSLIFGEFLLETALTVFYAATGASDTAFVYGWKDKVNAN